MGVPGFTKTENKILYDNDQRVARSHDETLGQEVFRTDPELKLYREGLLGIMDGLGSKVIDCSINGVLKSYFRNMTVSHAIDEFCGEILEKGRSVVFHLNKVLKDGRTQWEEDSKNGSSY